MAIGVQVWVPVMSWYLEQRRALEQQVKKYSDPPSEHLLPDLPPHARCCMPCVLRCHRGLSQFCYRAQGSALRFRCPVAQVQRSMVPCMGRGVSVMMSIMASLPDSSGTSGRGPDMPRRA